MKNKIFIFFIIISVALIFTGCNIFNWLYPGGGDNYEDLIAEGDAAYNTGDYETALDKYSKAMDINPKSSEARWGYFKALVRVSGTDFLYMAQAFSSGGTLQSVLNDPKIKANLLGNNGVFSKSISALEPIINNQCDGVISPNDATLNFNLAVAYFFKGYVQLLDSNGDGTYGGNGDLLKLDGNNMSFNPDALNYSQIQAEMQQIQSSPYVNYDTNDNSPLAIFTALTNPSDITNLGTGATNYLKALHDSCENSLRILKLTYKNIDYLSSAMDCLNRAVAGASDNQAVQDFYNSVNNVYQDVVSFQNTIEDFASVFNEFHYTIIGAYAYSGSVINFTPSPYTATNSGSLANVASDGINTAEFTNSSFYSNLISSPDAFTNSDITSLIEQWLGDIQF